MKAIILLLTLIPAPRMQPAWPVGDWQAQWGSINQQMHFHADGSYTSKEFGNGFWSTDSDGWIWFSERNDSAHYVMWIDSKTGTGIGFWHCRESGAYNGELKVTLRKKDP